MSTIKIAIDAMGGDDGPEVIVPAAIHALEKHSNLHLILVGQEEILQNYLKTHHVRVNERLTIHPASEIVEMNESPSRALRTKKDSSMRVAINLVKTGEASACVSAGNTGALMATARFVLKMLPGIDRPAIISAIPAQNKLRRVRILDLGANVDSTPDILFQFAVMGSVLTQAVDDLAHPTIALLNIGVEDIKGNELVRATNELLTKSAGINYVGYVEGDSIFSGNVDVIVCDGFVGNVALKTIEGLTKFIVRLIKKEFTRNWLTKISALFAAFVLGSLKRRLNPDMYNGASLVGLQGIVIKSHGHTTVKGFEQAIERAILEVDHNVPELIRTEVAKILHSSASN